MIVGDLVKAHKRAAKRYDKQREEAAQALARIESKRRPYWIETIVKPIAEALVATMPGWNYEILGPFGICCEVAIHFSRITKRKVKDAYSRRNMRSITFVHGDENGGVFRIRNTRKNTKAFAPNTIGEMNGMNHPNVDVPPEADVAWLRKWVR